MATKYLKYFPKPLLSDLIAGRWLPIIGSGFSRNAILSSPKVMPLWADLGKELGEELEDYAPTGPLDSISAYEHQFGRTQLIEKMTELLYVEESRPSDAHKAFCSLQFNLICTTNFDFLLERQYEQLQRHCTPLIDEDQLSINLRETGVALLKLHGDLHHPDRLVATEHDYDIFLTKYPLLATYLANLLITKTAVLIGYSLDDPDFRQVWQVVRERLGRSRRTTYTITVGAKPVEISRFERRGVKVVNLPGNKTQYSKVLADAFVELRDYWRSKVIPSSQVKEEKPLQELSLPPGAQTRLCFFAVPLSLQPFYRDRVFPIVQDAGFVPIMADDVVSPGENVFPKIDALIERALLVVVDASSENTLAELRLTQAKLDNMQVLLITDGHEELPARYINNIFVIRPDTTSIEIEQFLDEIALWFEHATLRFGALLLDEPTRLLQIGEYRAAIITAMTSLEARLRARLDMPHSSYGPSRKAFSVRHLIQEASARNLLGNVSIETLMNWLKVRNEVVHTQRVVTSDTAHEIVHGILGILNSPNW